jgi:hypothetical protein
MLVMKQNRNQAIARDKTDLVVIGIPAGVRYKHYFLWETGENYLAQKAAR